MRVLQAAGAWLALATLGCSSNPTVAPAPGEPFVIAEREAVELEQAGFSVEFHGVIADSRCPTDTRCMWGGNAEIRLLLTSLDKQRATTITLHTAGDTQRSRSRCAFGHTLTLLDLQPERVSGGSALLNSYAVTMMVAEGCKD